MKIVSLKHSSPASAWIDILRWVAALYVVVFHLRPVLFVGSAELSRGSDIAKVFYGVTSLGYESVMLFFVLSGFLVGSAVLKKVHDSTWSWTSYLIQRLTRLWLVLIPALGLTWMWSMLEIMSFHNGEIFSSSMRWSTFWANLLFLQGIKAPNFAQNLPLWSLTYEFWYYILFPCCVLIFVAKRRLIRLVYASIVIGMGIFLGKNILLYFTVWLLGALLSVLPSLPVSKRILSQAGIPTTLFLVLGALVYGKEYVVTNEVANFDMVRAFPADFIVSVTFAMLLYVVLHTCNSTGSLTSVRFRNISSRLAGFSYTLYLTHYPLVNFLRKWIGDGTWGTWQPSAVTVFFGFLILIAILLHAWMISLVTEAKTPQVRRFVSRLTSCIFIQIGRTTTNINRWRGRTSAH